MITGEAMSRKLILTNVSRLKEKYGTGFADIQTQVDKLIVADQARGLETLLIASMIPLKCKN